MVKAVVAAAVLQMAVVAGSDTGVDARHLRYERALTLPAGAVGQSCAVLDAKVFADASGRALNDLRVFTAAGVEVPFALTESEPEPVEVEQAQARNLGERGGDVEFDLEMPQRAYTDVVLRLAGKDFLATAKVWGVEGGKRTELGSYVVFDLSREKLARSTVLGLQEARFPELHVELHGRGLRQEAVLGAVVPPSRERQTVYSVVADTSAVAGKDGESVAVVQVPAHVPVERVEFEVGGAKEFRRDVTVTASGEGLGQEERVVGEIWRVDRAGDVPVKRQKLSVDAALAANMAVGSSVRVAVKNGDDAALPLTAVLLEMRERKVCFDAQEGDRYLLRYGDSAAHAPVYDYARLFEAAAKPVAAELGAEERNPEYVERKDSRPYTERHPELMWIGLLVVVAGLGGSALHGVKRQG